VSSVEIHRDIKALKFIDRIGDSSFVCCLSCCVTTVGITQVCRQIGQGIWLYNQNDINCVLIFLKDRIDWIDVLRSILINTSTAVTTRLVVTGAIRVVSAANLSVRGLGLHI